MEQKRKDFREAFVQWTLCNNKKSGWKTYLQVPSNIPNTRKSTILLFYLQSYLNFLGHPSDDQFEHNKNTYYYNKNAIISDSAIEKRARIFTVFINIEWDWEGSVYLFYLMRTIKFVMCWSWNEEWMKTCINFLYNSTKLNVT